MTGNSVRDAVVDDLLVAGVLDEYRERLRTGERPTVEEYVERFPEAADLLRKILATCELLDISWNRVTPKGESGVVTAEPLGDFRLIREVGRGGMGVVYEAEQMSLNRRVALKVLPFAATMDAKQLQRFRNEAMAAASLRHEHIVHVYGVGCERSVHFYAMELIEGQTLAEIIAFVHRQLVASNTTSDFEPAGAAAPTAPAGALSTEFSGAKGRELHRIAARVIADAADALEHAHSLGIVHRDIKPGNLMVDAAGKVYVTDFGLARFGSDAGLTMSGDLLGTLRYMSPEQAMARHGLMDHRTDIYSLGATLYELLTLRPAVDGADKHEILKNIAFEEPTQPRTIDKSIPLELATITLKCLAKNPNERYASAKDIADDLHRWLDDKPIKAKPPGLREQTAKWLRRHKYLVRSCGAVLGVALFALAISTYTIWKKGQEVQLALENELRQRKRADDRFLLAQEVVGEAYSELAQHWMNDEPGMTAVQRRFLEKAAIYFAEFAKDEAAGSRLSQNRATTLLNLGGICAALGQHDKAREAYELALTLQQQLVDGEPENSAYRNDLATTHGNYGVSLRLVNPTESVVHQRQAMTIREALVRDFPADRRFRSGLLTTYSNLAFALNNSVEKVGLLAKAIALGTELIEEGNDAGDRSWLGAALDTLAVLRLRQNQLPEARSLAVQAIVQQTAALEASPRSRQIRFFLANHHNRLSDIEYHAERFADAERSCREALKHYERLVADFPSISRYQHCVVIAKTFLAAIVLNNQRLEEALDLGRDAVTSADKVLLKFPTRSSRSKSADAHKMLGDVCREMDRLDDADKAYRDSLEARRALINADQKPSGDELTKLAGTLNNLAIVRSHQNNFAEAIRLLEEAIQTQEAALKTGEQHFVYNQYLCNQKTTLASCLTNAPGELRNVTQAAKLAREALQHQPNCAAAHRTLGMAHYRSQQYASAITELEAGLKTANGQPEAWLYLAMAYHQVGEVYRPFLYYVAAVEWMNSHPPKDLDSRRLNELRSETAAVLNVQHRPRAAAPN